jgi:hypothetical protein
MKTYHEDIPRRQFLQGSSAALAGALLMPSGRPSTAHATATSAVTGKVTGTTVSPWGYGISSWLQAAQMFDSYVGLPLAITIQKLYLQEGQYFTAPLPLHITSLAGAGCQFIICFYPSRTIDESAKLATCLQLLNSKGIVYQAALVNEWNCATKFATAQDYLTYWNRYSKVVKAAGVPLCLTVCASSNKTAYAKIQPGFPVSTLPDRYWIDYYATAYQWNVRLDTSGGLLAQAESLGVPAGIGEFGIGANAVAPMSVWNAFCPYLGGLASRLPLGCLYWGGVDNFGKQNVVTSSNDPKVPGIRQVIGAFGAN